MNEGNGNRMIDVRNLTKIYPNGIRAVDGVSFSVKKGVIFGFLGPNGAGKTTTQKILCTLLKPTGGEVTVAGYDVVGEALRVREVIGVVFQDPALDEKLTGRENLEYHARLYGMDGKEIKRRIRELSDFFEFGDDLDRSVASYSGGMRRKLEIARSVMHDPDVLFLDEPTVGLDAHTRRRLWNYILEMRKKRKLTIFLTTHYIEEAERLCDEVAIMNKGRIVARGTCDELKRKFGRKSILISFPSLEEKERALRLIGNISGIRIITERDREVEVQHPDMDEIVLMREIRNTLINRVNVVEMRMKFPSLEDVYVELTEDTGGDGSGHNVGGFVARRMMHVG